MKIFKPLVTLAFLIIATGVSAQMLNFSATRFNSIDLLNYGENCREDIAERVKQAIYKGKLQAFTDKELKQKLSVSDYIDYVAVKEYQQIPNPDNPDDIYDLIDTVLVFESYVSDFLFLENDVVECLTRENKKVYISQKQLRKHLDKRLLNTLDFYAKNGVDSLIDENLFAFSKLQIQQLGKTLYLYGVEGKMKAYRNDFLNTVYSIEEIEDRTSIKVNHKCQNPNNPDDIYDFIDTVVTTPFDVNSVTDIRIYFSWETEGFESEAKFSAIAPMFKPIAAGLELPLTSIFLLKANDYTKTLSKQEKVFWQHFYTFLLQNRSSNGLYDYYDESNLPSSN